MPSAMTKVLPRGLRRRLTLRFPQLRLVSAKLREGGASYDAAEFDLFYAACEDPWRLQMSKREAEKYEILLQACGAGPWERALEIGCSIGLFTELLAPRCARLLAVDISGIAVERARRRLRDSAHVILERRTLPAEMPAGPFDLVVCSDVLYYWPLDDLRRSARLFEEAVAPGGRLVVLHWQGPVQAPHTGDEVHDVLVTELLLTHVESRVVIDSRLDVFENHPV